MRAPPSRRDAIAAELAAANAALGRSAALGCEFAPVISVEEATRRERAVSAAAAEEATRRERAAAAAAAEEATRRERAAAAAAAEEITRRERAAAAAAIEVERAKAATLQVL